MIDVLDSEVKLVFVPLRVATILAAAVSQHPQQRDIVLLEQRQHPIVEQIRGRDRRLAIIKLGASDLGMGIDERLLVDAADALEIADIERVLGAAIAWMLALELAMRLLLGLGFFQRDDLRLGQHQTLLGALGFQRLEPLGHGLQIVALPHAAYAGGRNREPAFAQFVGDADLAEGRLLNGERNNSVFNILRHTVLQHRFLAADLLQSQFAALVVELLEAIEAVAAVAHHLASLADVAELLGKLEQSYLGADNLMFSRHGVLQVAEAAR